MRKIISLLLILAMLFSLVACNSANEEEDAVAGELVTGNENVQQENNQENQNDQQEQEQEQNQTPPADDQNNNSQTEPEKEDKTPPLSESGSFTVTFDLGFDNKTQTEKTDGKVTELKPDRAGYKLAGWFNDSEKWDFSKEVTSDVTLKAKWEIIEYTITCDLDGATLETAIPQSYNVEQQIPLGTPVKEGKVFVGWQISCGDKTHTADSIHKGTTGNIKVSPIWDDNLVVLGKYERDNDSKNGAESIVWLKLKEENGKTLLITKEIIDAKPFDTTGGAAVNWSNCSLRKWLNNSFYKSAFTAEEKSAIIETTVTTVDSNTTSTSKDFVFLLSTKEAQEDVMVTYSPRYASVTPYALANGAIEGQKGGWWWIRNKTSDYGAALCEDTGIFNTVTGYSTKLTTIGVRPCIWVDSSKIK